MIFFKKHQIFIRVVIWITIIGFVSAYIPLLFVSSDKSSSKNSDTVPQSQDILLTPQGSSVPAENLTK